MIPYTKEYQILLLKRVTSPWEVKEEQKLRPPSSVKFSNLPFI